MASNNYQQLIKSVRNSLDPENIIIEESINEEISTISYSDVIIYINYAMKGVEDSYTQRSKTAGANVKSHLEKGGISGVTYTYQGSVMTNTHVKGYSDIDLLVISEKFYTIDLQSIKKSLNENLNNNNFNKYQLNKIINEDNATLYSGNSLNDLFKLRTECENILKTKYDNCDIFKAKSIKITNTNLKRDVDIVIANWHDDILSIIYDKGINRGIQVYNKESNEQGKVDYPLISIKNINNKSSKTGGRLKKMIRFLKNLKGKSALEYNLSSFDINAICYDINENIYQNLMFHQLVKVIYNQLWKLKSQKNVADDLVSVDGREYILREEPEKMQSIENLITEIATIISDLQSNRIML